MSLLREATNSFLPKELATVDWRDIWERPLEDGTAFQWSIVVALANSLIQHGWHLSVPLLGLMKGNELMTLRNEIPVAHLAQAGHSAVSASNVDLESRFLQSVVPKIVFTKDGRNVSLFIEGCPYHMIATGQRYEIRPDILLLPGKLEEVKIEGQILQYKYLYSPELLLEGALRISSSRLLPVVHRQPAQDIPLPVIGVIECSVNKSARVATSQIDGYKATFGLIEEQGTVLVTGNEINADCGPMVQVNLATNDLKVLTTSLGLAGEYICTHLFEPDAARK